jgi:EmrB/QacA subfamily drug resistance transporter
LPDPVAADAPPASIAVLSDSARPWVFAAALTTLFMAAIESTIVATSMPTIVGALGGFELFSWVFTVYLLIQAVTIPLYGRLADLYGRKRILFWGIGVFLASSLLCGLAWSMLSLILFRVLQGLGAGAIMPVAMTLLGDVYRGADRARMQGYVSSSFGSAAILGPVVGAAIVAHVSWSWVFWVNVPFGLAAAVMLAVTLRENVEHRPHRLDYAGSLLMMLGTGTLLFVLVRATALSWTEIALLGGAALILLGWFVAHERVTKEPMLPLRLWRNRLIVGSNLLNLANGAAFMGIAAFLPAYIQGVMGRSTLLAGLVLTGMSGAWPLGGFAAGRVMLRSTFRRAAIAGGISIVAGSLMLLGLTSDRPPSWPIAAALLVGFGMGLCSNSFVVAVQASVAWSERGMATSSMMFTRILGQAIGTALFGGILNASLSSHLVGGGNLVDRLMDPALRDALDPAAIAPLMAAFDHGLHLVYSITVLLALVMLACAFALPPGIGVRARASE